ncbi:MAG TPA: hypothetical protein VNT51_07400 [Miltoncostaeaceae bacterium]|nr:hypothetical protein [Miltoncostaeaceae bacterium]
MRRLLASILVLGALLAWAPAALGAPADVLTPGGLHLAAQDDQLPVAAEATLDARLDRLASTGVRVTRVDVLWEDVAPTAPADGADPEDPAYRWERLDRIFDGLAARGITPIADVYRTPSWANGGRSREWAPDPDAYEAFMRALATRYSGDHRDARGVVHARVGLFEPWNEPNLPLFLKPQWRWDGQADRWTPASPAIYAELHRRAHRAVKDAQPDAWVIGIAGAPSGSDRPPSGAVGIVTFIRALAAEGPLPMDAYSQHLYPALAPDVSVAMPSYRRLPDLLRELDALTPGLPLLITELGYTTAPTPYRSVSFTEEQQAEYLLQAVAHLRAHPRVRLGVWFNLQDNPDWPAGLVRADDSRKPAWGVFTSLPAFLADPVHHAGTTASGVGRALG